MGTTYGAEMTFTTADIPSDSLLMPDPCSADSNALAQPLLGPNYLMCAGSDSVELTLNNYQYGAIQWQYSTDTISWFDIPGAIDEQLTYKPDQTQFVRAAVSYANCATEYSEVKLLQKTPSAYAGISRAVNYGDTLRLQANMEESATGSWQILQGANGFLTAPSNAASKFFGTDSLYRLRWTLTNSCGTSSDDISVRYIQTIVSSKVVMVDTTDIIFSDSAQMADGFYMISFSDPNIVIGDSTILVSLINGGFLRRVNSWSMSDDSTYAMHTSQATLNDLLVSGVIDIGGSNGSNEDNTEEENQSAKGIAFLDHLPTREELRSNPDMNGKMYLLRMNVDYADGISENFTTGSSPRGTQAPGMTNYTNDRDYKKIQASGFYSPYSGVSLENVEFTLEPTGPYASPMPALCYIKEDDYSSLNFGFNNLRLNMTADLVLSGTVQTSGEDLPLIEGVADFAYINNGLSVKCQLKYSIIFSLHGTADITGTMRHRLFAATTFTRFYADFQRPDNIPNCHGNGSTDIELISDYSYPTTANLNVSLSAVQNFKLFDAPEGPHTEAGYTAKINYCNGSMEGWRGNVSSDMFVKLDLKGAKSIDSDIPENREDNFSSSKDDNNKWKALHKDRTYPYKMKNLTHTTMELSAEGTPVGINVLVWGDGNKPMKNVSVHFEPKDGGSVNPSLVQTDASGWASTMWSPGTFNGNVHQLNAEAYDCNGKRIEGAPITFYAYEPGLSACANSNLQLLLKLNKPQNGLLTLVPQNGTPLYTYSLDGSDFGQNDSYWVMNMPSSDHLFKVTDANGCTATQAYNVSTPNCASLGMVVVKDDGYIAVEGINGESPYQYSLGGTTYSEDRVYDQLQPGTYTVYVRDNAGCQCSQTLTLQATYSSSQELSHPCDGALTVTDIDGHVYHTLKIGQQCWLAENMRTTRYSDGDPIGLGGSCFYANNDQSTETYYGLLYTWNAATRNGETNSNGVVQGVCPNGWHVPSDAEWGQFLGQPQLSAGCPAKALATQDGWNTSTAECTPGYQSWYNNGLGFNAAPAGQYYSGVADFGAVAWFWSTTESEWDSDCCAWGRNLRYDGSGVGRTDNYYHAGFSDKSRAYSVRCLRD